MNSVNGTNDVGSRFPSFLGFPSVMMDTSAQSGPAGYKNNTLNSSYMNYSANTNSITDMHSISYSREGTNAPSLQASVSVMQMTSPGCVEGGMFTHVPAPPTAMVRRTMDTNQLSASTGRRLDNSLSFSASASYAPVPSTSWTYLPPPPPPGPDGTHGATSQIYTSVPPNGVLMRMIDAAGNAVWCLQPDCGNTAHLPPPPPPNVSFTSPLQASVLESPPAFQPTQTAASGGAAAPPPFKVSPLAGSLRGLPASTGAGEASSLDAQPGRSTSTPPTDADLDDYEYEPYNANTLANRRVGSLDRVRCSVHGKERSAQNMVMMRHKTTNEILWRCKRSSQCKARTIDFDDTPLSSKESTLRSNAAEALLSSTMDQNPAVPLNMLPSPTGSAWQRQPPPPPPQYTLVSPTNMCLPSENSFQGMSPPMQASYSSNYTTASPAHMVALPPALAQGHHSPAGTTFYPLFGSDNAAPPPPPQEQPQQQQQGGLVNVNGVTYRIIQL